MGRCYRWLLPVAVALCFVACGAADRGSGDSQQPEQLSDAKAELQWEPTWEAAVSRAEREGKAVLAFFSADWVIWCAKLEETTLRDRTVASYLADRVVPVKLDTEGNGTEAADEHEVDDLPTVIVFSADGAELGRVVGYASPSNFVERVQGIVEG